MGVETRVGLRLAEPRDESFLLTVYASTRAPEMAVVPWTAEQKQAFVRMQYRAQRDSYHNQFPEAQTYVIEQAGQPVGRMIVDRSGPAILLMDIALLPEVRNHGLGTELICDLLDEADHDGRAVELHVEDFNPAMRLYLRLGFVQIGEAGLYTAMTRQPKGARHDG